MSSSKPSTSATAPNNASLANVVAPKDLTKTKHHLEHVSIDHVPHTLSGGIHLGPSSSQADYHKQSHAAVGAISGGGNSVHESSKSGEVSVQSSVTIDTTQSLQPAISSQIQSLLSKLSTTTEQIDEYSRRANEQISTEANREIQRIITETQESQDALLRDASARSLEIECEYSNKLKSFLQELDASKASNLASLEKDLYFKQERLLESARDEIDRIREASTAKKISIMKNANQTAQRDVDRLTEQVKVLGEAEVERRMNSTTTTVITTQTTTAEHEKALQSLELDKSTLETTDKNTKVVNEKHISLNLPNEPRTASTTRI